MKEIKKYMALDGTIWDTESECLTHEKKDREQMYEWAQKIRAYCEAIDSCRNCPFYNDDYDEFHCQIGMYEFLPQNWAVDDFESDE